jgi:hypothetical protein
VNLAPPDAAFRFVVAVAVACTALIARADTDEAWLRRAALPAGTRPLLAIVLDRSEATLQMLPARESYDSTRDYGAAVPVSSRCNSTKVYFRRGPGPAPDCSRQAGFDLVPPRSDSGLQCNAARAALSSYGFYIASRAAQWRASAEGGYWSSLREDRAEAVECRADRGRHGTTPGTWFASNGTGTPWTNAEDREIDWDRPPFADAFIFYAGNYLNFLQVAAPTAEHSIAELTAGLLAKALDATDDLDVALMRVDDDGGGGYVARAPASNHLVSADLRALATTTPEGPHRSRRHSWRRLSGYRVGYRNLVLIRARIRPHVKPATRTTRLSSTPAGQYPLLSCLRALRLPTNRPRLPRAHSRTSWKKQAVATVTAWQLSAAGLALRTCATTSRVANLRRRHGSCRCQRHWH